jgi:hypothetical protein
VQPRQLAHRCLQSTPLQRLLAPPADGASRGPHRPGRFLHCTALVLGPNGFGVGVISTAFRNTPTIFRKRQCSPVSQLREALLTRSNGWEDSSIVRAIHEFARHRPMTDEHCSSKNVGLFTLALKVRKLLENAWQDTDPHTMPQR